ncbi:hypothetical protein DPEC_G00217000 [Dallia pectoralis]|uniref:Uncharacterized protein n=1 Tax=Dallia pectoralis TaxID=75939 RepID=A0ACC2G2P4_DALPE|nr:hypothetical protein DPEC_G00217000 [Dallia pectoralis]
MNPRLAPGSVPRPASVPTDPARLSPPKPHACPADGPGKLAQSRHVQEHTALTPVGRTPPSLALIPPGLDTQLLG